MGPILLANIPKLWSYHCILWSQSAFWCQQISLSKLLLFCTYTLSWSSYHLVLSKIQNQSYLRNFLDSENIVMQQESILQFYVVSSIVRIDGNCCTRMGSEKQNIDTYGISGSLWDHIAWLDEFMLLFELEFFVIISRSQ